jgi:MHS family proline/betaine transporter-like MFS transporter
MQQAGQLAANPIVEVIRKDRRGVLTTLGLAVYMAVSFYVPFVWLPTWLARINQPPLLESHALAANTIALLALLVLTPAAAALSDRIGRRPMFLTATVSYALLSYPLFVIMAEGALTGAIIGGLAFAFCNSFYSGCMAATMVELFPTSTRYSGVAIGYNVGQTLFGGTAPFVATALIRMTDNVLIPAYYLSLSAIVGTGACLFLNARFGQPLEHIGSSEPGMKIV